MSRGYTITLTDAEYDALKDRITQLEAALRKIRDFEPVTNGDYAVMDAIPAMRKIAIVALGSVSETKGEQDGA